MNPGAFAWLIFFIGFASGLLVSVIGDWLHQRGINQQLRHNGKFDGRRSPGFQPFDSDPQRAAPPRKP